MDSKERVRTVLAGGQPDRLPVSVWGHDFLREWSAAELAAQTVETQQRYGYDFVKINPRWTLFAEPWGNRYEPPVEQKFPKLLERIVEQAEALSAVPEVGADHPVLREHVDAVRGVVSQIGEDVDCLATVFSPLATLGLLCGGVGQPLLSYLDSHPDDAHRALRHISATYSAHVAELLQVGAAGVFFAPLQWTSLDVCDPATYAEFGETYDLEVLKAAEDVPFNMLHVCGNHIEMSRFYDYPVTVLNWDNFGRGNPSLSEVARESGKVVAGGIPHRLLHKIDRSELERYARGALDGLSTGVMLAGGCGIGALTGDEARRAVVSVAEAVR